MESSLKNQDNKVILASAYFGPVQWYQKLNRAGTVLMEQCDSYRKQTYRNRCTIAGANGAESLTIPVERPRETPLHHTPVRDIRISDHGNWRHIHWNALASSYSESAFFDYYVDDIRPFYEKRWEFLIDFNEAICMKMCELLDIDIPGKRLSRTTTYEKSPEGFADYRDIIDPKHPMPDDIFTPQPYYQVFRHKHGFLPNLSILDLLFNMGPESILYL